MADYIYNPAESIKQSFQQTQAGIGNIFSQVIAQQQRDYNLAESAFQNIEALKKDVNIFGQKNITAKSNDLLKQAGSAILKDGKLDYSKLGEIRQSISDIKDLKAGYDVGAKEYERMLQLGVANKDNLVSFERFYKELSSRMSDENLVKNPQDLQKAMAETYTNNLDSTKMYGKSFLSANPYQKIAQDITDPKTGALMRVQAELPAGWTIDARGNKIPPAPKSMVVNGQTVTMDYADQELARLQSTNPDVLVLMKKQAGFGGQNMSDKDLVKAYIDRIPMTVQSTQVKSSDDLRKEAAQAKAAEVTAKYAEQSTRSQLEGQRLSNIGRGLQNTGQALENRTKQLMLDSYISESNSTGASNEIFFASPKSLVMPIGEGNKDVMGKSQKINYDPKTGTLFVSALKDENTGFNVGETQVLKTAEVVPMPIPFGKLDSFKKSIMSSALSGIEASQKPIVKKQVEDLFNKAKFGTVSNSLLPKLSKPKTVKGNYVTLSKIRELYNEGQFKTIDEGIQNALSQGYPVTRE
jgi:hypothetical protein